MSDEQKRKMSKTVKGRDMQNRFVYATLGVSH